MIISKVVQQIAFTIEGDLFMKHFLCVGVLALGGAIGAQAVDPVFGVDQARFDASTCNASVGCPDIDTLAAAGVQWIRLAAWWWFIEPSAPDRSQAIPGVYGRLSGLHTYASDWSGLDYPVSYANSHGINVLLVISDAPMWANGNPYSDCFSHGGANCVHGGAPEGYVNLNADDLRDLSYNMAVHFGSSVQAYEAWNEPNQANEFNVDNVPGGNYWALFVSQIFSPIHDGVKAANGSTLVIAPSIGTNCTTPSNCGTDWAYDWIRNIGQYATTLWDVMAFNRYPSSHNDLKNDMDNTICPYGGPVWVTEVGYDYSSGDSGYNQANQMYLTYVDNVNRQYCWTKTFYHDLRQVPSGTADSKGLLNPDGSARQAYWTYESMTGGGH